MAAPRPVRPDAAVPPVGVYCVVSMALVVVSGIILAARLPRRPPMAPVWGLVAAATLVIVAGLVQLARTREFAWGVFFRVAGWALVAYAVIAGLLELVFVHNHVRGAPLAVLTVTLALFAVDVPLLFGFSVARFQAPSS